MRGRSCTQPFLVEGGTCRLDAFLLPPRWANRSPPHPTRLRRPTFPPRGRLWGCATLPVYEITPPSPPSRWAGRYGRKIQGRRPGRKKERTPCRVLKNQSRESRGEKLSPLALFPPVSREKRGPPPGRRPTGRCAPRPVKAPTTRRVRSTAPFPRPGPGGNPRGRSGPAMVPTEPPTDGAAPKASPRGRACRAPSPRQ